MSFIPSKDSKEVHRYRQEDGVFCIDLFLTNLLQLFDRRDPSPFREKDLDEDFVKYLIISMREIPKDHPVKIAIKMPDHNPSFVRIAEVEEAIRNFFSFEVKNEENELSVLFKQGRYALVMGLVFVTTCKILSLSLTGHGETLIETIKEGLSIIGWVAMWRPINIFLYDWWPFYDRIKLYNRLSKVKVEVVTD